MQEALLFILGVVLACFTVRAVRYESLGAALAQASNWQPVLLGIITNISTFRQFSWLDLISEITLGFWFITCWHLQFPIQYYALGMISLYLVLWDWLRLEIPVDGLVLLTILSILNILHCGEFQLFLSLSLPLGFMLLTFILYKIKRLPVVIPWGDVWALGCIGVWISNAAEFVFMVGVVSLIIFYLRQKVLHLPLVPSLCIAMAIDIVSDYNYFL